MSNELDVLAKTTKAIHEIEIPNREIAEALVRSAMRVVANDLANNNLQGAKDTQDKLKAVEQYLKAKLTQLHADRITQNIIAAGRMRTIRQIGQWCVENVNSEPGNPNLQSMDRTSIMLRDQALNEMGIDSHTYWDWLQLAQVPEDRFEKYLSYFLNENIKQNLELTYTKTWKKFFPSKSSESSREHAPRKPLNIAPCLNNVCVSIQNLQDDLTVMVDETSKGEIPVSQVWYVFDRLKELSKAVETTKIKVGELYH